MARYAANSGNWNSPSTWSVGDGGPGGASVPTYADDVYIFDNRTVTLTEDAQCSYFQQLGGTLDLGSYKLSVVGSFNSLGTGARTINMGSGTIEVHYANLSSEYYTPNTINFESTGLTLNPGTGKIIINSLLESDDNFIRTGSKSFYEVRVNLGEVGFGGTNTYITGSPSFHILDIRSANSQPHEFQMDPNATISTDIFSVLGASTSARLEIATETLESATINISQTSSGANASMWYVRASGAALPYIGSSSVQWPVGNTTWLLQDASTQTQGAFFQMF